MGAFVDSVRHLLCGGFCHLLNSCNHIQNSLADLLLFSIKHESHWLRTAWGQRDPSLRAEFFLVHSDTQRAISRYDQSLIGFAPVFYQCDVDRADCLDVKAMSVSL